MSSVRAHVRAGKEPPGTQPLLFPDECALESLWTERIGSGDLDGAAGALRDLRAYFPTHERLAAREEGLALLRAAVALPEPIRTGRLADLARSWAEEAALHGLHADAWVVENAVWRVLGTCLVPGSTAPVADGLLPAEIAARGGDLDAAWACVSASLADLGELPFLRQLQGWVLWHWGRPGPAAEALSLALCHDAAACRPDFLFGGFAPRFRRARPGAEDDGAAMRQMAFAAWREGVLPVTPANPAYERALLRHLDSSLPVPPVAGEPDQRFLSLLFLAETARQRGEPVDALLPWRKAMQELDQKRFRDYMASIA